MQEAVVAEAAPVAAVEGVAADQVEGARDRPAAMLGEHQQHALAHRLADRVEERFRQVGLAPALVGGGQIEVVERLPVAGPQLGPGERPQADAGLGDLAALAADLLALARGEGGQKVLEAGVAGILPVVLNAEPAEEPGRGEALPLVALGEGDVRGRDAVPAGELDQARRQCRGRALAPAFA